MLALGQTPTAALPPHVIYVIKYILNVYFHLYFVSHIDFPNKIIDIKIRKENIGKLSIITNKLQTCLMNGIKAKLSNF